MQAPVTAHHDPPLSECRLCRSNSFEELFEDFRGNRIQLCRGCGVQWMNPQYTDAHLEDFYSRYYATPQSDLLRTLRVRLFSEYIAKMEGFGSKGILLDIGCGEGHFLEAALARGWQVEGFDVDAPSVAQVSARLQVPLQSGDFSNLSFNSPQFDAIVMHQVLEHLKDPGEVLRRVKELLAPGGTFFVAVPNIRSFSASLKRLAERTGLRRRKLGSYYDTDHHLWYYTPKALQRVLAQYGFETVYTTGCQRIQPGEGRWKQWLRTQTWERLMLNSTFYVIARHAD